jgi:hypothetical protein
VVAIEETLCFGPNKGDDDDEKDPLEFIVMVRLLSIPSAAAAAVVVVASVSILVMVVFFNCARWLRLLVWMVDPRCSSKMHTAKKVWMPVNTTTFFHLSLVWCVWLFHRDGNRLLAETTYRIQDVQFATIVETRIGQGFGSKKGPKGQLVN